VKNHEIIPVVRAICVCMYYTVHTTTACTDNTMYCSTAMFCQDSSQWVSLKIFYHKYHI